MSQGAASIEEQYALMDHLRPLAGGRLHDGIFDWVEIEHDAQGLLKPFMAITFGIPIRAARDRSILGAVHQPYIQPFTVDCWGPTADRSRRLASAVMQRVLGFVPDAENASEIECSGGGDFRERDTQGRPSRYCKRLQGEFLINMHTPDVVVPTP